MNLGQYSHQTVFIQDSFNLVCLRAGLVLKTKFSLCNIEPNGF